MNHDTEAWLIHAIGALQASVMGNRDATRMLGEALHRRIDNVKTSVRRDVELVRREVMGHVRRLDKSPTRFGPGDIPTIKYTLLILGFLIVGTLGHLAPEALKSALVELAKKLLLGQLAGG